MRHMIDNAHRLTVTNDNGDFYLGSVRSLIRPFDVIELNKKKKKTWENWMRSIACSQHI